MTCARATTAARNAARSRPQEQKYGQRLAVFGQQNLNPAIASTQQTWKLTGSNGVLELIICGKDGVTCRLRRHATNNNQWAGQWLIHERMAVELVPASGMPAH